MKILKEYRTATKEIKDERILNLIKECTNYSDIAMSELDIPPIGDLNFYMKDLGWRTIGRYTHPLKLNDGGSIILNTRLVNNTDDEIKGVILHELAHYIKALQDIKNGYTFWRDGNYLTYEDPHGPRSSHGKNWKDIAKKLSDLSGGLIIDERSTNIPLVDENGNSKRDVAKYHIVCNGCGKRIGFNHPNAFAYKWASVMKCTQCGNYFHREEDNK